MSHFHSASGRVTLVSAALLTLALLAGCESTAGTGTAGTDIASSESGPAADPAARSLPLQTALQQVGDRVHFALDRYDLAPEAEATLQRQAALLQNHPQTRVTIEGHADERGTREYNLALGERRAETVRNYLVALGVAADRISVISYGKERPECADAAEPCWAQNRRGVTAVDQ
jgi:peptidoglycan-associated lipoprotein